MISQAYEKVWISTVTKSSLIYKIEIAKPYPLIGIKTACLWAFTNDEFQEKELI